MSVDLPGTEGVSLRVATTARGDPSLLHPAEAACLSVHAVPARQREFAAGRTAAAHALQALGLRPAPVTSGSDRVPVWPFGVVGSISHSRSLAAAAVARRSDGFRSVGLDIEEAEALTEDLVEEICIDSERDWLTRHPREQRGLLAKAIFSAKEAVYKCQYPLTRTMFGFDMIKIDFQMANRRFSARFVEDVEPFRCGTTILGEVRVGAGHIVSLVILR